MRFDGRREPCCDADDDSQPEAGFLPALRYPRQHAQIREQQHECEMLALAELVVRQQDQHRRQRRSEAQPRAGTASIQSEAQGTNPNAVIRVWLRTAVPRSRCSHCTASAAGA